MGKPLADVCDEHGCRARSSLRRYQRLSRGTPEYISRDVMFRMHRLAKGTTDRWSGREEDDALRVCPPQVWKQPNTRHISRGVSGCFCAPPWEAKEILYLITKIKSSIFAI